MPTRQASVGCTQTRVAADTVYAAVNTLLKVKVLFYQGVGRLCVGMALTGNVCNNFTTNMLKAYLSVQAFSLSAFVISKTHKRAKATQKTNKRKSVQQCENDVEMGLCQFVDLCFHA